MSAGVEILNRLRKGGELTASDIRELRDLVDSDKLCEDTFRSHIMDIICGSGSAIVTVLQCLQVGATPHAKPCNRHTLLRLNLLY